jgi:hypothetical protein
LRATTPIPESRGVPSASLNRRSEELDILQFDHFTADCN